MNYKKLKNLLIILLGFSLTDCSLKKEEFYNSVKILDADNYKTIVEKAAHVVPSKRQYKWQKMEFTCFVHFGINTFTGREWGTGFESPKLFNPTNLDTKQWIAVAKSAGMKMVMLTAKHHDGFCLWQTQTTEHSVKNSPWKSGKGDVLKELSEAAHKEDLKIGVYLSPADLYEIEREGGTYGNNSVPKERKIPSSPDLQTQADTIFTYKLDDYNAFFMNQLYEVLTQYGEISEVWFDGANPKQGTGQNYDYKTWYAMIRALQPNAVIAIKGPDVRWIGNEAGKTRPDEWSVLPLLQNPKNAVWKDKMTEDLGSRKQLLNAKYLYWYPAEADTPIRHGWFYRDEQQYLKPLDELLDIWYRSVGNNSVLLLNISPDRRGLIPKKDAQRMQKLGNIIRNSFTKNLLEKATFLEKSKLPKESIENLTNKDLEKSWKLSSNEVSMLFEFEEKQRFNRFVIQEDILNNGQRIEQFSLAVWKNEKWEIIYNGGTVGYKKIARFPMQETKKVRLQIEKSRLLPSLGFIGIFKSPELLSLPTISRNKSGEVRIVCQTPDPFIYYTLDGTEPTISSNQYNAPFALPKGGIVKAIATVRDGKEKSAVQEARFDICAKKWTVVAASSFAKGYEAANAIDGNPATLWHTPWEGKVPNYPHSITINLGEELSVCGITYLPRQDGSTSGSCTAYSVEGSLDGKNWKMLKKGRFDNIKNNPILQEVTFSSENVKYLRWTALEGIAKSSVLSVAELGVKTK